MEILYLLVSLAVCISVHEASHALMAYWLGDPTAKMEGRISLNPLRHLDLLGTLMILIAQFGWGKPTPFNPHNLSHPKRDSALIALAGPISNLLTAILVAAILKYTFASTWAVFDHVLQQIYSMSIVLFLFNLLPIAPLDGSKFIGIFIPSSWQMGYQEFLRQGPIYLLALVIGDRLLLTLFDFSILGRFFAWGFGWMTFGIELLLRS